MFRIHCPEDGDEILEANDDLGMVALLLAEMDEGNN